MAFAASLVIEISSFHHQTSIISSALRIDDLALILDMLFAVAGIAAVLLSLRSPAVSTAGHGEYYSLMLFSVMGMAVLVSAQNLVSLFLGFELLSIPLYILCASEYRREGSLESGLKYLVIGSVGSATLLYGLALVYGATGSTQFSGIATADPQRPSRPRGLRRPDAPDRPGAGDGRVRVQGLGRPLPPVDPRRLRGRPHPDHRVHGHGHQGGRTRAC